MKVVITAPSLSTDDNVSGISSVVRMIERCSTAEHIHFTAGRKDGEPFGPVWAGRQLLLPYSFWARLKTGWPDVVHINTSFEPRSMLRDLALAHIAARSAPVLLHIHGGRFVARSFEQKWMEAAAGRLLRIADRVVVLSEQERQALRSRFGALDAEIDVLPNAVDVSEVPEFTRGRGEKTFLYMGRLEKAKGLSFIIDVCRTLKAQGFRFAFVCCGRGPEETSFSSAMSKLLGEKFEFKGAVSGGDNWNALGRADIFILPSEYEGLPMAMLEAMAAGCVPVVSRAGSIPAVIEDGRNGFLIDPRDLTQAVGRLKVLLSDETGWPELRRSAISTVRERFNAENFARRLDELYARLAFAKPL
jgi:glycosyltransferase involved in cell wall biosynthesis